MPLIYKIASKTLWSSAKEAGVFRGAPIDFEDGYIHFSAGGQVAETAAKHFAGQSDLLLIAVDTDQLGADLRWEKSRNDELFPHLYGELSMGAVVSVRKLEDVALDSLE